jgi:dinuclear metal center YbgI/SA1388 family protein
MVSIKNIMDLLDEWAPPAYAEDFDNVGLLVGESANACTGVLVCHDCIEEILDEAIKANCNLIVCFHPILFSGLKKITGKDYVQKALIKAIRNNIAIYALHTRLDNHPEGVNKILADRLGLIESRILIPKAAGIKKLNTYVPKTHAESVLQALHQVGAGSIGNYSECSFVLEGTGQFKGNEHSTPHLGAPLEKTKVEEIQIQVVFESFLKHKIEYTLAQAHPYENVAYEIYSLDNTLDTVGMGRIGKLAEPLPEKKFLSLVKEKLQTEMIRYSSFIQKPIQTVAVLGGSGSFAITHALAQKADAFITADLKYHQFYQGGASLLLLDIGHFESEQFIKNLIVEYLSKKMPNFAIILSHAKTNPVNYF